MAIGCSAVPRRQSFGARWPHELVDESVNTFAKLDTLGCYLFAHRLVPRERLSHIVSLQGVKMRRPSRIHIAIDATGEHVTRVRVGGRSVAVGHGQLQF